MAKKARKNGNGARKPKIYKAYFFEPKEGDPIKEAYRTALRQAGMTHKQVEEKGGPVVSTQKNWENNKVMRPLFCTIAAGGRALGMTGIKFGRGGVPYFTDEQ